MNDLSNIPRIAKLFWNGRSQAVRLPKEFRFDGTEVRIRREGRRVVIEPVNIADWDWLDSIRPLDDDAAAGALDRPGPEALTEPPVFD